MAEKQLVLSFFADEPAADAAAAALKDSGTTSGDAIGILVLDAAGNLKVDKVGARSWPRVRGSAPACSCSAPRSSGSASLAARPPAGSTTRG